MFRIDDANAVGSLPTPDAPSTPGYFSRGDPSTSRPATRVTDDWLNAVQEELLAPIVLAGLALSKTADGQLRDAFLTIVQRCLAEYATDVGVANAYVLNPTLAATAYADALHFRFKAAHTNTAAATVNVSALGAKPILRRDGTALRGGEIPAGAMCEVVYSTSFSGAFQLTGVDVTAVPLDGVTAMTGLLTLFGDATQPLHAVTKRQLDNVSAGFHLLPPVDASSAGHGNIVLSGLQTIDGVALTAGKLAHINENTLAAENGVYTIASGAWTRITQMDAWSEVPGAVAFVKAGGTLNGQSSWVCVSQPGGTINTDAVIWTTFLPTGHFQPLNALLSAISGLEPLAADRYLYTSATDVFAAGVITAFSRTLLAGVNAAAWFAALGLGTAASKDVGSSGHVIPMTDGGDGSTPVHFTVDLALPSSPPTNDFSVGYRARTGYRQDTDHTVGNPDAGLTIKHGDLSSPVNYWVDTDATTHSHKGQVTYIRNGPGAPSALIHVRPINGAVLRWNDQLGDRVIAPNGYAELIHDADNADEWMLRGDGIS